MPKKNSTGAAPDEKRYSIPEPCNLPLPDIDKIGEKLADILKFQPGGDIFEIVSRIGGTIKLDMEDKHENGSIIVDGEDDFTVYLSQYTGPLRDRFTIAHEIGHYILHSNLGKKRIQVPRYGQNLVETEANYFAAGFLMPQKQFIHEHKQCSGDRRALAAKFLVSEKAVLIRQKTLLQWSMLKKGD